MPDKKNELISLGKDDDFSDKVKPKKIKDISELFLFACPECENPHFRHAGYLETLLPYIRSDKEKKVDKYDQQVMVCTKCKACYVWVNEQMYDVTEIIDLEAWEKTEKDLHKATGPGGQC